MLVVQAAAGSPCSSIPPCLFDHTARRISSLLVLLRLRMCSLHVGLSISSKLMCRVYGRIIPKITKSSLPVQRRPEGEILRIE